MTCPVRCTNHNASSRGFVLFSGAARGEDPPQRRTFLSGHNLQLDERISFSANNRRVLSECDDPGVERFRSISADKPLRSWDE